MRVWRSLGIVLEEEPYLQLFVPSWTFLLGIIFKHLPIPLPNSFLEQLIHLISRVIWFGPNIFFLREIDFIIAVFVIFLVVCSKMASKMSFPLKNNPTSNTGKSQRWRKSARYDIACSVTISGDTDLCRWPYLSVIAQKHNQYMIENISF